MVAVQKPLGENASFHDGSTLWIQQPPEFGKQFVKLNKALRLSLQQEEQESMEKELFDEMPKTVTAIPNQA